MGGESQLRLAREAGLGGTAEPFWAAACFNSVLLERAVADLCAVLSW
jgi:hypothetical protein